MNCCAGSALVEICWRANESRQSTGSDNSGRGEINERVAIAHASFEIAIGSADRGFAFLDQAAPQSNARAATGRQRNRACAQQSLPIAVRFRFRLHFGASWREIELYTIGHVSPPGADN